jgi:hypothetical protein
MPESRQRLNRGDDSHALRDFGERTIRGIEVCHSFRVANNDPAGVVAGDREKCPPLQSFFGQPFSGN